MVTSQQERIETLERRLQDGFARIGEAMNNGIEVTNWERHWIELLREYERLSDELAAAPLEQVAMPGLPRREAA
jgi:hypothetical protein